jgi:CDP-paratose 2-epimerase
MSVAIITGSAGLVGSEATRFFCSLGLDVIGLDNDLRARLFGPEASTKWVGDLLKRELRNYHHLEIDLRHEAEVRKLFAAVGSEVKLIIHTAAQPSHDWAAQDPSFDFAVNATSTLSLLEAARRHAPDAVFIFMSTNKVYGDHPNSLPFVELKSRWEIDSAHRYWNGVPEDMPIDGCMHSVFGASKVAADVMVQEYGQYFGIRTACFRAGCITGPYHAGTRLHGFYSYLMKCCATGAAYEVYGYNGKQVRDNIHSCDVVQAMANFFADPRCGAVYNIGGGRFNSTSVLEAINECEEICGRKLNYQYVNSNRRGDHLWWISDVSRFKSHYPQWRPQYSSVDILREIYDYNLNRWQRP